MPRFLQAYDDVFDKPMHQGMRLISAACAHHRLACARDKYYDALGYADSPRQGDLDGRGNLSEKALTASVDTFLDVCLDPVQVLRQLMNLDEMRRHIEGLVHFRAADKSSGLRAEAIVPLH